MKAKALIIAPHCDDEALSMGGTICNFVKKGVEVHVCFVAHRLDNYVYLIKTSQKEVKEAETARRVLGYKEAHFFRLKGQRLDISLQEIIIPLEHLIKDLKPDYVFYPHHKDSHQDHESVARAARIVLRPYNTPWIMGVYAYETGSTLNFMPNVWSDISKSVNRKCEAMECYRSEIKNSPHPRSKMGIIAFARYRGMQVGYQYAEAFKLLRGKL